MMPEKDLEVGVEIHRRAGIEVADIGQMPGDVAGGNIEAAAQRDGHVGKIAAHPNRRRMTSDAEISGLPEPKRYSIL